MKSSTHAMDDAGQARCPLCRAEACLTLLDRPKVAALSNRCYATREAARAAPCGQLKLVQCAACGFVFNCRFDPALINYDTDYESDQSGSPRFTRHLDEIRARLLSFTTGRKARIMEIGCGQGDLLEVLVEQGIDRIRAVGYDTTWRHRPLPPGLRIEATAFGAAPRTERSDFDLVLTRHVIEHVADPVGLLRHMAAAMGPSGRVCIETPALEWIIAGNQMQDFFYEHCNYFTATSLTDACRRAGLGNVRVETTFAGQYLWAEAQATTETSSPAPVVGDYCLDAQFFARWRTTLLARTGTGAIALWGAGAKGVTFAAETDPSATLIACLIDVNPNKQGKFVGRSGHPVVSPAAAADFEICAIVVMNPNYHEEIAGMADAVGLHVPLLPC